MGGMPGGGMGMGMGTGAGGKAGGGMPGGGQGMGGMGGPGGGRGGPGGGMGGPGGGGGQGIGSPMGGMGSPIKTPMPPMSQGGVGMPMPGGGRAALQGGMGSMSGPQMAMAQAQGGPTRGGTTPSAPQMLAQMRPSLGPPGQTGRMPSEPPGARFPGLASQPPRTPPPQMRPTPGTFDPSSPRQLRQQGIGNEESMMAPQQQMLESGGGRSPPQPPNRVSPQRPPQLASLGGGMPATGAPLGGSQVTPFAQRTPLNGPQGGLGDRMPMDMSQAPSLQDLSPTGNPPEGAGPKPGADRFEENDPVSRKDIDPNATMDAEARNRHSGAARSHVRKGDPRARGIKSNRIPQAMRATAEKPMFTGYVPGAGEPGSKTRKREGEDIGSKGNPLFRIEDWAKGDVPHVSFGGRKADFGKMGTVDQIKVGDRTYNNVQFRIDDTGSQKGKFFGPNAPYHFDVAHRGDPNASVSGSGFRYFEGGPLVAGLGSNMRGAPSPETASRRQGSPPGTPGPGSSPARPGDPSQGRGASPPGAQPGGPPSRSPDGSPSGGRATPLPYQTAPQRFQPPGGQALPNRYAVPGFLGQQRPMGGPQAPPMTQRAQPGPPGAPPGVPMPQQRPPGAPQGGPPPMQNPQSSIMGQQQRVMQDMGMWQGGQAPTGAAGAPNAPPPSQGSPPAPNLDQRIAQQGQRALQENFPGSPQGQQMMRQMQPGPPMPQPRPPGAPTGVPMPQGGQAPTGAAGAPNAPPPTQMPQAPQQASQQPPPQAGGPNLDQRIAEQGQRALQENFPGSPQGQQMMRQMDPRTNARQAAMARFPSGPTVQTPRSSRMNAQNPAMPRTRQPAGSYPGQVAPGTQPGTAGTPRPVPGSQQGQRMSAAQMAARLKQQNPAIGHEGTLQHLNQNRHLLDRNSQRQLEQINHAYQRERFGLPPANYQSPPGHAGSYPWQAGMTQAAEAAMNRAPVGRSERQAAGLQSAAPSQPKSRQGGTTARPAPSPQTGAVAGRTSQGQLVRIGDPARDPYTGERVRYTGQGWEPDAQPRQGGTRRRSSRGGQGGGGRQRRQKNPLAEGFKRAAAALRPRGGSTPRLHVSPMRHHRRFHARAR